MPTIPSYTEKTTPVDADLTIITDSEATNGIKKLTWASIKATLKTYFDTLYTNGIQSVNDGSGVVIDNTDPANPVININPVPPLTFDAETDALIMQVADTSQDGYLTTGDWNTFNNKQPLLEDTFNIKTINGASILGEGDLTVGGAVNSVNTQTGDVVLTPDDLDDSASTHKFTTADDISKLAGIPAPGASGNIMQSNDTDWGSVAMSIATTATAQTLTNKRKQPRVYATTSLTTLTPEIDTYDVFRLTAQAANLTIANHSTSTPADGELLEISIIPDATPRTLTFGTNYVAKAGTALPTTTVASKMTTLLFEWVASISKYNLLVNGQEA